MGPFVQCIISSVSPDEDIKKELIFIGFEFGILLIGLLITTIWGSVELSTREEWREYFKLKDFICDILMTVCGCVIFLMLVVRLTTQLRGKFKCFAGKFKCLSETFGATLVSGLGLLSIALLLTSAVLSVSDIIYLNAINETVLVSFVGNRYEQNQATSTEGTALTYVTTNVPLKSKLSTSSNYHPTHLIKIISNSDIILSESRIWKTMKSPLMTSAKSPNGDSSNISLFIDNLQIQMKCCGVHDYSDWPKTDWGKAHPNSVPDSCCRTNVLNCGSNYTFVSAIFTQGCFTVLSGKIKTTTITTMVLSILISISLGISMKWTTLQKYVAKITKCRKSEEKYTTDEETKNTNRRPDIHVYAVPVLLPSSFCGQITIDKSMIPTDEYFKEGDTIHIHPVSFKAMQAENVKRADLRNRNDPEPSSCTEQKSTESPYLNANCSNYVCNVTLSDNEGNESQMESET